jgi:hypothetical protein
VELDRAVAWSVSGVTTPITLQFRHFAPDELEPVDPDACA